MSKFNRSNFYKKSEVDGRIECDLAYTYFNDYFEITRPLRYYAIERVDIQRPDLLSVKIYGKEDFWWIIGEYNAIDDWWNDLEIGQVINIPDKQDIDDFYLNVKKVMKNG